MAANFEAILSIRTKLSETIAQIKDFVQRVKQAEAEIQRVASKKVPQLEIKPEKIIADLGQTQLSVESIQNISKQFNEVLKQELLTSEKDINEFASKLNLAISKLSKPRLDPIKQSTGFNRVFQSNLAKITQSVNELESALDRARSKTDFTTTQKSADSAASRLAATIAKLRNTGKGSEEQLKLLNDQLARLVAVSNRAGSGVAQTTSEIKRLEAALRAQNLESDEFTNRLDIAVFKLIRYRVAFTVLHGAIMQIKDTVKVFAAVDHSLAQLAKVLPPIGTNINTIREEAFRMGKQFGVSITEVLSGMETWAQLGLNQVQILKATEAALLGVNTTGLTNAQVTDAITAAIFSYGVEVENVTSVVDKWMAVQARFAVTGADLANALFKVGSAAEDFGLSMDQLNGIITAIGTVTRATGSEVGNAFKTILAKIPQEETIKAFQGIGVAVFKSENEFRNLFDVLNDAAKKWPELTDVQRANLAISAAGVRQYSKFIALMNEFSLANAAVAVSQSASGSAMAANVLEVQTLQKAWQSLVTQADELKFAIGQNLAKPISILIDSLKFLSSGTTGSFFAGLTSGVVAAGTTFITLYGTVVALKFLLRQMATTEMGATIKGLFGIASSTQVVVGGFNRATVAVATFSASLKVLVKSMSFWTTILSLAIGIFTVFSDKVTKFNTSLATTIPTQNEIVKSLQASTEAHGKEIQILSESITKRKKLQESLKTFVLSSEEYAKITGQIKNEESAISAINARAIVILSDYNKSRKTEKQITDELSQSMETFIDQKSKVILKDREALEVAIALAKVNNANLKKELSTRNEVLESTKKQVEALTNQQKTVSPLGDLVNSEDITNLETFSSVLKEMNDSLRFTSESKNLREPLGISKLGDAKVQLINFFTAILGQLETFKDRFEDTQIDINVKEEGIAKLDEQIARVKAFKEQADNSTADSLSTFAQTAIPIMRDVVLQGDKAIKAIPLIVDAQIRANDEAIRASQQALDELLNPGKSGGDGQHFKEFGKATEEIINFRNKVLELKFDLQNGAQEIAQLNAISQASGNTGKLLAQDLAQFYESQALRTQSLVSDIEKKIFVAEALKASLENDIKSTDDKGKQAELQKQADRQRENLEVLSRMKQEAEGLLDTIGGNTASGKRLNDILKVGDASKSVLDFKSKMIDLQLSISLGAKRIRELNEASIASGGAIKNTTAELASFHEGKANEILDFIKNIETEREVLKAVISDIDKSISQTSDPLIIQMLQQEKILREQLLKILDKELELSEGLKKAIADNTREAFKYNSIIVSTNTSLARAISILDNYSQVTDDISGFLEDAGRTEKEVLEFQNTRLENSIKLVKEQAKFTDDAERENFVREQAVQLTNDQLDILKQIATVDLTKSLSRLNDGISVFRDGLESAFSSIPDVINESFSRRKELSNEIREVEMEIAQARIDGDRQAADIARKKLKELREDADSYRQAWLDIKEIVGSILSSVSDNAFKSISKRFSEDLSNIQIGGASIGEQMGKSIAAEFDNSVAGLISQMQSENDRLLTRWDEINLNFLTQLADVLQRPLLETGQFGPPTPDDIKFANTPFGPPTPLVLDKDKSQENLNKAFRSGSILAGQIISNYIGRSGSEFGQTVAGFLQSVIPTLAPNIFSATPAGNAAFAGLGLLTGLIGSLFGEDKEPQKDLIRSVDKNTEAIQANTITLKEWQRGIFNAPTGFNFNTPGGGGVPTGGNGGNITVQVNVTQAGVSGQEIANVVTSELNRIYRINQSSIGTRSTRVI